MPQLPSGQHVGIDAQPVNELLEKISEEGTSQKLSQIQTIEDLKPYIRILELAHKETDSDVIEKIALGGNPMPDNLVSKDSGFRLSDFPQAFVHWTQADRVAFDEFVAGRLQAFLAAALHEVKERAAQRTQTFLCQLEAAWMKAGVHPSQESGWDDWPEDREIDSYDVAIALGQFVAALNAQNISRPQPCIAIDRLQGFWSFAVQAVPWLDVRMDPLALTSDIASELRNDPVANPFPEGRAQWWRTQLFLECLSLFNEISVEQFFAKNAPKAWGVVKLAALMVPVEDQQNIGTPIDLA